MNWAGRRPAVAERPSAFDEAAPVSASRAHRSPRPETPLTGALTRLRTDDLVRNSVAMMATTVGNSGFGYIFWLLAAHRFSAAQVGSASAIISATVIAATFADVGLRTTLMQELPQMRETKGWSLRVSSALVLGTLTSAVAGCVAWFGLLHLSPQTKALLAGGWPVALLVLTIALTLSTIMDGISTAERRGSQVFTRNMVVAVAKVLALLVAAWLLGSSAQSIFLATGVATLIGLGFGLLRQLRAVRPDWHFSLAGFAESVHSVRGSLFGHHLLNLGGWLPAFVLPLEVVARQSPQQNAYFTFTWMVGNIFFMVSPSVASALFVQGRWDIESLAAATRRATRLIAILLGPIAILLLLFGHAILGLFGHDYSHYGYPLLVVLAVSAVPDAITNVRIAQLRAQRRLHIGAGLNIGMAVISIGLAWFLLPPMGIVGAGVAWLTAQSVGTIWIIFDQRRPAKAGLAPDGASQ